MKMKYSDPAMSVAKFDSDMIITSNPQTNGANIVAKKIEKQFDMGDRVYVQTISLNEFKMED